MRLPFTYELTEARERPDDLVDGAATCRRVERSEAGRVPERVVGRLDSANRTVNASAQQGDRVADPTADHVIGIGVGGASAIRVGQPFS